MLDFNQIKKGRIIELDGEPYQVIAADFMRKQKARPVMRTTLRSLQSGSTKEHTFQQADKVPEADITRQEFQYLYREGKTYTFMNPDTFEQIEVDGTVVGEAAKWMREGENVESILFSGQLVNIELPIKIDRKVIQAPPGIRGDSSSNVMKDVVVEGGVTVKAPLFINEGDTLRIDTRDSTYVERV